MSLRVSEQQQFGFHSWEGARGEFGTGSASPLFHVFVREAWEQRWQWQNREMLGLRFVHTLGIRMSKALLLRVLDSQNAQQLLAANEASEGAGYGLGVPHGQELMGRAPGGGSPASPAQRSQHEGAARSEPRAPSN